MAQRQDSGRMMDEMERFEAEISRTARPSMSSILKPSSVSGSKGPNDMAYQNSSFPPKPHAPPTLFLPTQLQRAGVRHSAPVPSSQTFTPSPSGSTITNPNQASVAGAAVISNKPVLYLPEKELKPTSNTVTKAPPIKKLKVEEKASSVKAPSASSGPSVLKAPSSTVGSATVKAGTDEPVKVQKFKKPKIC